MRLWQRSVDVVADSSLDQASGLRQMLGDHKSLQIVTFVAGCEGVGRSSTVASLASALARLGKEVLILDEHNAGDDVAATFGLATQHDLIDVLVDAVPLSSALLKPLPGVSLLRAAQAMPLLGTLNVAQQLTLHEVMGQLEATVDIILVDANLAHPDGFSPFGLAAQETVVMLSANSQSITDAYTLIKRVSSAYARQDFRILVNKVQQLSDARTIFDNIASVARQKGVAQLRFAGGIPFDIALSRDPFAMPFGPKEGAMPLARAIRDLAIDLLSWRGAAASGGNMEQFLRQLLNFSQPFRQKLLQV